jgi:carbon-monoxide dehydrogenase large subunit/6-hydroxypseudooxynicotine dehydrogenase subunit gamma
MRGAGEGGINGAGAAIANAVEGALQWDGVITRLPITPLRLKKLIDRFRESEHR